MRFILWFVLQISVISSDSGRMVCAKAIGLYLVNRNTEEKDDNRESIPNNRRTRFYEGFGGYQKLVIIQALVSRDSLLMAR